MQLVKEEYNIEVTRQQVETYDPTKRAGKDLSAEFKKEFTALRKEFLDKLHLLRRSPKKKKAKRPA